MTVIAALLAPLPALAADPTDPRSGFYVGGHFGYGFGYATATLADLPGIATGGGTTQYGMLFGGVQAGYEHFFPSRVMLGIEADVSFPEYMDFTQVLSYRATGSGSANEQLEYLATLRGRLGYAWGAWTPFVTGGLAMASTRFSRTDATIANEDATPGRLRAGYAVGAGVDHRLSSRWSARAEYLYTNLGLTSFHFATPTRYDSQYDFHRFRVGLNYRFGEQEGEAKADESADDRGPGTWEIHGQTTFIYQGYPPIRAPYDGQNSLPAGGQSRETWTVSAFLGVRLWQDAELYFNPETLQGFGLASTVGSAGIPNGEAQKSNFPFPHYNTSRLFLRQEIGLGGEREKVESDYGQLAGERDVSRITLQAGKFAVHDLFDNNSYAQDPRTDFLNWSIWAAGAFDYPGDKVGLTYGVAATLHQPDWAARVGYFLVGDHSNSSVFDTNLLARGGYMSELELHFRPNNQPGALRLGAWTTETFAGSYADAVSIVAANPSIAATDAITQTRRGRNKSGYYINVEQALNDDIGVFGRCSWNDGRSEISAFTDIDSSLSFGTQIKGTSWGRADDRLGIAGALNNVSADHVSYLSVGGLGVTVGDGQLTYASEGVLEAFYAMNLVKGLTATADYQLLVNPAYNADRGPVHVFAGRLRANF